MDPSTIIALFYIIHLDRNFSILQYRVANSLFAANILKLNLNSILNFETARLLHYSISFTSTAISPYYRIEWPIPYSLQSFRITSEWYFKCCKITITRWIPCSTIIALFYIIHFHRNFSLVQY
jgi:hypothetical protein